MKNCVLFLILVFWVFNSIAQQANLSHEKAWAIRTDNNTYKIYHNGYIKEVFYCTTPYHFNTENNIAVLGKQPKTVEVKDNERLYFAYILDNDTVYFSERRLNFDNSSNFRDLGGLPTKDGRTTKYNTIFRCGDIGVLTAADLEKVTQLEIETVIDFRGDDEIEKSPDKYPSDEIKRVEAKINLSNDSEDTGTKQLYAALLNPKTSPLFADSIFVELYKTMAQNLGDFKPFFDVVKESESNFLFHCTAGKDRTGIASALLLFALGVEENLIFEEFYLSNKYTISSMKESSLLKNANPEVIGVFGGVHKSYLRAFFDELITLHGSISEAMEKELGVDEKAVTNLRLKYLKS